MAQVTLETILSELVRLNAKVDTGLAEIRTEMKTEFASVRAEMKAGFTSVDHQLAEIRKDVKAIREQTATNTEAIAELKTGPRMPSA